MNPALGLALFTVVALILAGAGGVTGYLMALERQGQARITLQFRISDLEREIRDMIAQLGAESAAKGEWRTLASSWQEEAMRFKLMAEKATLTMTATAQTIASALGPGEDPPSTREADRRAVDRRRAQEERESASDTRRAVGVSDDEAAPVPQLRGADDDH